ncbi:MAG: deoxyribonuclease IV [Muribaculaceae bacterium]|nr:deoxyribonuclease IV [Muribaculaceae bacterium]
MKYIGAHISVTGGVSTAPVSAAEMGMNAFALFTRNPTRWKSKAIPEKEAEAFRENCTRLGFTPDVILPHDSYLINLGSPEPEKLAQSREAFLDEMHRCEQLGLTMLNFHPGSHMRMIDDDDCLKIIAESVNGALAETSGVTAVLESTAGQGSNLGYRFEQLARIIELIDDKSRVGVCVDTCHTFAAGYDLVSDEGYDRTWHEFDSVIGFNYLRALHINDSKKGVGSRVDRHAPIGKGELGSIFFARLMADPRFDNIPLILETPDESLWQAEIEWLRKQAENDSGN